MSAKEMLVVEIQDLTEEQAERVLSAVHGIKQPDPKELLWERLSKIPGIRVPKEGFKKFRDFEPIRGTGIPASELLAQDRR